MTLSPNSSWQTLKKIKNPKAVFEALKSNISSKVNIISMHATNNEDKHITYDAYVKLSDIEEYFMKTYFLIDGIRVSSKEFKILNISKQFTRETIKQAVMKLLGSRRFFIKRLGMKPSKNNPNTMTIFITIKGLEKCRKLKDIWSIEIDHSLYQFALANATKHNISFRKKFSREFIGFDEQTSPAAWLKLLMMKTIDNLKLDKKNTSRLTNHYYTHNKHIRITKHHQHTSPSNNQHFTSDVRVTGSNRCPLGIHIISNDITSSTDETINNNIVDDSVFFTSATTQNDGIVERLGKHLDYNTNFIILIESFYNINGLIVNPQKMDILIEWYQDHQFDFMEIEETNTNSTNLQFRIKDFVDCNSVTMNYVVYYLPPKDKSTQQYFEHIINNTLMDPDIIHIWIGVNLSMISEKEDIPLCFTHIDLVDPLYFSVLRLRKLTQTLKIQTSALLHDLFQRLPKLAEDITVAMPAVADLFENFSNYQLDLGLQKVKPKASTQQIESSSSFSSTVSPDSTLANHPQQPKELLISSSVIPPARPALSDDIKGQALATKKTKLQEGYTGTSNLIITEYQQGP
ncbi:hypothetical protein GLOIN_2v1485434 [Rhizophagus clarus]|uniref:Uncharacterized protein n=1 Tax=Rhizophagus clarus TaxID=94130 RepID=A0A8H3QQI2_9GLOM|nr:hypothetical protein GLOIN_2v1485434 [Rhizophagus clarus]